MQKDLEICQRDLQENTGRVRQEQGNRIRELENALQSSEQEFSDKLMETQAEFKVKLKTFIGIQKFLMPYKLDKDQISIECNEHFVEELV